MLITIQCRTFCSVWLLSDYTALILCKITQFQSILHYQALSTYPVYFKGGSTTSGLSGRNDRKCLVRGSTKGRFFSLRYPSRLGCCCFQPSV